jgi:beta-1,2-mannobiose phosphorylase / 1,2-beta-oligomannan phosphorylase
VTIQDFPYEMTRAGVVLRPDADAPYEVEGVLNPAAAWSPDGRLVLFSEERLPPRT